MSSNLIYTLCDRTPYAYRIAWSSLNKYYYGIRYGKHVHPDDLFKTYFTSSKEVKTLVKRFGAPDIIEIRKIFSCVIKCQKHEARILNLIKFDPKYLNKPASSNFKNAYALNKNTVGMIAAKDREGNTFQVKITDPRFSTGEIQYISSGRVTCVDPAGRTINISVDDKRYLTGEYKSIHSVYRYSKDTVVCKNLDGIIERISKSEFLNTPNLVGNRKNLISVINVKTKEFKDVTKSEYDTMDTCIWVSRNTKWLFHTPLGDFTECSFPDKIKFGFGVRNWCDTPDVVVSIQSMNSNKLKGITKEMIGKTHKELGYWKELLCK